MLIELEISRKIYLQNQTSYIVHRELISASFYWPNDQNIFK